MARAIAPNGPADCRLESGEASANIDSGIADVSASATIYGGALYLQLGGTFASANVCSIICCVTGTNGADSDTDTPTAETTADVRQGAAQACEGNSVQQRGRRSQNVRLQGALTRCHNRLERHRRGRSVPTGGDRPRAARARGNGPVSGTGTSRLQALMGDDIRRSAAQARASSRLAGMGDDIRRSGVEFRVHRRRPGVVAQHLESSAHP